jgi:hypothetical protein
VLDSIPNIVSTFQKVSTRSGQAHIELHSKIPRRLSSVQEIVQACQDLLSIACQRYCDDERLTVLQPGCSPAQEATFHAIPFFKEPTRARRLLPSSLLFRFDDIKDGMVFRLWLEHAERLRPIRALYFLAVYGENYVQGRFLALVQAVEGFHRRFRDGVYMEPTDFQAKVVGPLAAAIPSDLDRSLQEALRSRSQYGNDYSLRRRLKALFAEHQLALDQVVPNAASFIEAIVAQRNRLTHSTPETDGTGFDAEEWLRLNFLLRVLLEMCFLKAMGFADEQVRRLAERCGAYQKEARWLFRAAATTPKTTDRQGEDA